MDTIRPFHLQLGSILKKCLFRASYEEYVLLLLVIISSSYIYNRGSVFPKSDPFEDLFFQQPQTTAGKRTPVSISTRNIGEKVRQSQANFVILWGSQSGTAEALAHRLARDVQQRLKSIAVLCDFADYEPATLSDVPESVVVVFVISTYGEGDPSHNAIDFLSHITTLSHSPFSHLRYVAFGCGNSDYRYFNKAIDDTASAMDRCGAQCVAPVGKGDEASRSTQEDFLEWKEGLFSLLVSNYGMSDHKAEYQPMVHVKKKEQSSVKAKSSNHDMLPKKKQYIRIPVVSREVIASYKGQNRSCIDVKLDLSEHPQVKYRTGDHIAIWPSNPSEEVSRLLRVLGLESQQMDCLHITVKDDLDELKVPSSTTIYALLSQHLDICAPVTRETVLTLAQLAPSRSVKNEIERIGNNRETYADFLDRHHVNLGRFLELMNDFDSNNSWTKLPLSFIVDFVPAMQHRLYSIASSSTVDPRRVGIVVSVKPGTVPKNSEAQIHGVASTYLSTTNLPKGRSDAWLVRAEIHRSTFKLPVNLKTPVIMVAAGTGIAPFRAFIQERARLASIGWEVGPMILFLGSQNRSDSLYYDEFSELAATKGPTSLSLKLITAFSRPRKNDDGSQKKTYVQDQVLSNSNEVVQYLLEDDAAFYICGATTMAKSVGNVVLEAVMQRNSWSHEAADKWRQSKRKAASWHEDVWA